MYCNALYSILVTPKLIWPLRRNKSRCQREAPKVDRQKKIVSKLPEIFSIYVVWEHKENMICSFIETVT